MNISSVSNNQNINRYNPNFEQLVIQKKALKTLGCTKEELLSNDFLKRHSAKDDIIIRGINASLFKPATKFVISIGKGLSGLCRDGKLFNADWNRVPFSTVDELNNIIKSNEENFYRTRANYYYYEIIKSISSITKTNGGHLSSIMYYWNNIIYKIASLPNNEKDLKWLNTYILQNLKNLPYWLPINTEAPKNSQILLPIDWTKTPALSALENNNLELLKFFKSKGENLNQCLDLMKEGKVSDEAREILKDVKYQDEKIFELFQFGESDFLRKRFLENNPDIDINSRDQNGDTPVTRAVKEGNFNVLNFLKEVDEVNWNVQDTKGQNAAIIAMQSENSHTARKLLEFLRTLPKEKFDINALNIVLYTLGTPLHYLGTPLGYCLQTQNTLLDSLLDFEEVNVVKTEKGYYGESMPLIFMAILEKVDVESLKKMVEHPSFDISVKHHDMTLQHFAQSCYDQSSYYKQGRYRGYISIINNQIQKYTKQKTREAYEKNGMLTIEQIDAAIEIFKSLNVYNKENANFTVNVVEDTLTHLLADIHCSINDFDMMVKMAQVLEKMKNAMGDDTLLTKNLMEQNVLDKAIEAENVGLVKLLADTFPFIVNNPSYFNPSNCNNEEIIKILSGGK